MSLLSKAGLLARIRRSKESRANLVASNLDKGIAFQIRSTRDKRNWTQAELAVAAGMAQNNISRLERADYGKHTLSSLKRIADALDVALIVRLIPFSQYIDWLSGTPHLDEGLRQEALAVPSFEEENESGVLEKTNRYWELSSQSVQPIWKSETGTQKQELPQTATATPVLRAVSTHQPALVA